jgi:hypothetical protein
MKIEEALLNVTTVVSNARLTMAENDVMRESLVMIKTRCERADELKKLQEHEKD